MNANQYEEHLAHSAPCSSRWDGFCRGDVFETESGTTVVGRMRSPVFGKVEIVCFWQDYDESFAVLVNGKQVSPLFDTKAEAAEVGHWWLKGCPR